MNRALHEAYRTIPHEKLNAESEALHKYKASHILPAHDTEKWLSMPRKYTRNSVRFTLPIDTYDLTRITPFEYVSRHVWISDYRKQLYKYVFEKYLPKEAVDGVQAIASSDEVVEGGVPDRRVPFQHRTISFANLNDALADALGFHGTQAKVADIKAMLMLNAQQHSAINFRSWCGLVAFGERFLNPLSHLEDRCDEVYMFLI